MEGPKWHGYDTEPLKAWSVKLSEHNVFQIKYLSGQNPYQVYEQPLIEYKGRESAFQHQNMLTGHGLTVKQGIWAAEPGTGKSLAAIQLIEQVPGVWYWVAPKSALVSIRLELEKWDSPAIPRIKLFTYEGLKNLVNDEDNLRRLKENLPIGLIFDECQKLKNPGAQRTEASTLLADLVRLKYGESGYIILMSGTPAPKSPLDWFSLVRIARPGFLKEGSLNKFRERLCLVKTEQSELGHKFPKIITWFDNEKKCKECGQLETDIVHRFGAPGHHIFQPSKNEISYLYERMKGLTVVVNRKDCLDLPEKVYKRIVCPPTQEINRIALLLTKQAKSSIEALTLLRELSDGFQYKNSVVGEQECSKCLGTCRRLEYIQLENGEYGQEERECSICKGTGKVDKIDRTVHEFRCPKDDALEDLLDEYEEIGRLIIYAGFTGSIDKIVKLVKKIGWEYIRVDGRGWESSYPISKPEDQIKLFQDYNADNKIAFIGHPGSAGTGLTLTASPVTVFYSNDFNGESRPQAEDRTQRTGSRGSLIIDLIHLKTDIQVLDNLLLKRKLERLTLGDIEGALNT